MTHEMVVGTSEPQDFQLTDDGEPIDGTSWEIGIEFRETVTALASVVVEWLDQSAGTVRVTITEDIPVGTYHFRFTLTDGGGTIGYAPNEAGASILRVVKV